MMIDLPSSDQASSEGPALIPIVGSNTERRGESVLSNSFQFIQIFVVLINETCVYLPDL